MEPQQIQSIPLSETAIIKAIYTNPENLINIVSILDIHDFSYKPYRILYNVIKKLVASNTTVNADSILAWLQTKAPANYAEILQLGGANWIDSFYDKVYKHIVNLDEHIKFVSEQSDGRYILDTVKNTQSQIEKGITYDIVLYELEKAINTVRLRGKQSDIKTIGYSLDDLKYSIINQSDSVLGINISKKYPKLNKMLKNLQPNRLTVILSNYKTGKSSLILDISWFIAHDLKIPVLFGDTELFEQEFQLRLLAKVTGYTYDYIQFGTWKTNPEHLRVIEDAIADIKKTPFYWVNVNRMERSQIAALVKLSQLKYHIGLFVYDYIKSDLENLDGRIDKQVERKVDMLKEDIAKTCNIHVLSAVQLNESTGKATDSKGVYRLADSVVTLKKITSDDSGYGLASHMLILDTSRNSEQGQQTLIDINFATQRIHEL